MFLALQHDYNRILRTLIEYAISFVARAWHTILWSYDNEQALVAYVAFGPHCHTALLTPLCPYALASGDIPSAKIHRCNIVRPVSYTHLRAHETPEHLVC